MLQATDWSTAILGRNQPGIAFGRLEIMPDVRLSACGPRRGRGDPDRPPTTHAI